jgi:hypothetical protein
MEIGDGEIDGEWRLRLEIEIGDWMGTRDWGLRD